MKKLNPNAARVADIWPTLYATASVFVSKANLHRDVLRWTILTRTLLYLIADYGRNTTQTETFNNSKHPIYGLNHHKYRRLSCFNLHDFRLYASSHSNYTHTQNRRHCNANIHNDGSWLNILCGTRLDAVKLAVGNHQRDHNNLFCHHLPHQNGKRPKEEIKKAIRRKKHRAPGNECSFLCQKTVFLTILAH